MEFTNLLAEKSESLNEYAQPGLEKTKAGLELFRIANTTRSYERTSEFMKSAGITIAIVMGFFLAISCLITNTPITQSQILYPGAVLPGSLYLGAKTIDSIVEKYVYFESDSLEELFTSLVLKKE